MPSLVCCDCLPGPACSPATSVLCLHTSSPGRDAEYTPLLLVLKLLHYHTHQTEKNPQKTKVEIYHSVFRDSCCTVLSLPCVFKLGQTVLHVFPSPPAHLHRVHPSSHSGEGRVMSYVIHGEDAVSFTVVLLSDAAKPKRKIK